MRPSGWSNFRWAISTTMTIVVLAVGFSIYKLEDVATDAQAAADQAKAAAAENARQNQRLDDAFAALTQEAETRTRESCVNSAERQEATRKAFLGLFQQIDEAYTAIGRPPPAIVEELREGVETNLPELTCPAGSPIVIPEPATTTTTTVP